MKVLKLFKKYIGIMAVCGIVFSVTACGSNNASDNNPKDKSEDDSKVNAQVLDYTNNEPINLWKSENDIPYYDNEITKQAVTITPYIADNNSNGGCVIVCPGGGYNHVTTEKEGVEPALAFNENGISAFVLNYRVAPYNYNAILSDVLRAVRFVRFYAKDFGIDENKISVMGFSAGGHLAAMALEHFDDEQFNENKDDIDKVSAKPDNGILCYPVITMTDPYAHKGSRTNFLGSDNEKDENLQKEFSAELGINKNTPPCFIWHCKPDTSVPYQNSQLFADSLTKTGIDCNYHLYDKGSHGLGMAKGHTKVEEWFSDCVTWLKTYGY